MSLDLQFVKEELVKYKSFLDEGSGKYIERHQITEEDKQYFGSLTVELLNSFDDIQMIDLFQRCRSGSTAADIINENGLDALKKYISDIIELDGYDEDLWKQNYKGIAGVTKSQLAAIFNPEDYIRISSEIKIALSTLGHKMNSYKSGMPWNQYVEFVNECKQISPIMKECGFEDYSLHGVEGFLYYVHLEYNGKSKGASENTAVSEIEAGQEPSLKRYGKNEFLEDVFIDEPTYDRFCRLLECKKNIILQGPPGVGKTFSAKRLAYSIMGVKDNTHITYVQFHQNYSYEEFIMGYRPNKKGFSLEEGVFLKACKRAKTDPDGKYFIIIDEINRGNLSKIMGELMVLLESDKRDSEIMELPYTDQGKAIYFSVPSNLYVIGMMNTADRGLAMMDYALRRRFAFCNLDPAFGNKKFISKFKELCGDASKSKDILNRIQDLNKEISESRQLGRGFCIGHSYFCASEDIMVDFDTWYNDILEFEIRPLLEEYWYDDPDKVNKEMNALAKGKMNEN